MNHLRRKVGVAATGILLVPFLGTTAAFAAPPEGCIGLPDVPDAFVCVMAFTPENAVPTVTNGTTTVVVPEICVFACFGPTPVDVPTAAVVPNSGTVAVIRYKGQDYPITTSSIPGIPVGSNVPPGFGGHGCGMLAVADDSQPDTWLAVIHAGPVVALNPAITIEHTRCILHDGPMDEPDQIAMAPGLLVAKGVSAVPPAVTSFSYDPDVATLRLCLRMVWRYDFENVLYMEEICATPAELGTARVVV